MQTYTQIITLITALFVIISMNVKAQIINDLSIPILNDSFKASVSTSSVNSNLVSCDGNDVQIFPSNQQQSEIHISINKQNPQVLLLSSNTYPYSATGALLTAGQGAYWSTNGGVNWAGADVLPNGAFGRGDPTTAFDAAGNGYITTLNATSVVSENTTGYLVQRTNNNGVVWQTQTNGVNINGADKEMIAADDFQNSPFANNFYCAFSVNPGSNGIVQFNRSTNQANTFSAPITLRNTWGQGANVQTGPNGNVYVCWADYTDKQFPAKGLGFVRSTNGGQSFTAPSVVFTYTGIDDNNAGNAAFGNIRVNSFPSMAVDKSNGTNRGRIYIVYDAKENGNGKSVVQIRWSDNQGTTWSAAKTFNINNGRQNWFPWISVDASNGNIYVIYYSLDAATGFSTNTYVAISNDGGANFTNQRVSDVAHTTVPIPGYTGGYCGDYIGITSHAGKAYAAWYDNRTGQWQDYVSQVSNADIAGNDYLCTSGNYSVTNVPANSAVGWSVSPAGIANPSCTNCTQTTLNKGSIGTVTLTATITNACGATSLVISKNISVGFAPVKDSSVLVQNSCSGTYQTWAEYAVPVANAVKWNWTKGYVPPGGDVYIDNPSGSNTFVDVSGSSPSTIKLTYTDVCGNVKTDGATIFSNCHSPSVALFEMTPNPAVNNVSIKSTAQTLSKGANKNLIYAIKLLDGFGNQRKLFQYKSGIISTTIPIDDLKSGIYLMSVFNGSTWSSKSLIVQK